MKARVKMSCLSVVKDGLVERVTFQPIYGGTPVKEGSFVPLSIAQPFEVLVRHQEEWNGFERNKVYNVDISLGVPTTGPSPVPMVHNAPEPKKATLGDGSGANKPGTVSTTQPAHTGTTLTAKK